MAGGAVAAGRALPQPPGTRAARCHLMPTTPLPFPSPGPATGCTLLHGVQHDGHEALDVGGPAVMRRRARRRGMRGDEGVLQQALGARPLARVRRHAAADKVAQRLAGGARRRQGRLVLQDLRCACVHTRGSGGWDRGSDVRAGCVHPGLAARGCLATRTTPTAAQPPTHPNPGLQRVVPNARAANRYVPGPRPTWIMSSTGPPLAS